MPDEPPKIDPCPFCQKPGAITRCNEDGWYACCSDINCWARGCPAIWATEAEAIAAWNARPTPPMDREGVIERMAPPAGASDMGRAFEQAGWEAVAQIARDRGDNATAEEAERNAAQPLLPRAPAMAGEVERHAKEVIDRAISRLQALPDYAGRPAWDKVVAEELRAAITALSTSAGQERVRWLPIETAPKEELVPLILFNGSVDAGSFWEGLWISSGHDMMIPQPSKWMPLPPAPIAEHIPGGEW